MAQQNPVQKYLPVIVTVIVVFGIVALVRFNASKPSVTPERSVETPPPRETKTVMWIITQFDQMIKMASDRGESSECDMPEGFANVDSASGDGFIVRGATGARMLVGLDCQMKDPKLVPGLANPSGLRAVKVSASRRDGAGVLEVSDGKYTEEITLRGKNSRPYRDPEVVGWMDDNIFVVTAFQADSRYALTVQTTGRIMELAKLPENAAEFRVGENAFWHVTVTPGLGIELGPRGPSELHRVSTDGTDTVMSKEDASVIERVSVGPDGSVAYSAGGTLIRVNPDGKALNAGTGIPLGWSDGDLIVKRNSSLWALSADGKSRELAAGDVADATAAWIVRQTLDATSSTQ